MVLLVLHAAATWFLAGLVWFVQLVHYPLMAEAARADFVRYEALHQRYTTWIVAPVMTLEAALAVWLTAHPPENLPGWSVLVAAGLLAGIWASTFAVQVPIHARLAAGFDARVHRRLVRSNWFRTAAWSVRAVIAAMWLVRH
ncbi:MAG: hypothetical protein KatS3mg004_0155 [Bryobacteraceae bacterium]|nr:MAG: hypothetical protein KatS3mg004_0155 [Bryobacteraceae bacterium]